MTISTSYCKDLWNVNKYNTIQVKAIFNFASYV